MDMPPVSELVAASHTLQSIDAHLMALEAAGPLADDVTAARMQLQLVRLLLADCASRLEQGESANAALRFALTGDRPSRYLN